MRRQEDYLAGAAAGVVAGLVAVFLMEKAQERLRPLAPPRLTGGRLSTGQAAETVSAAMSDRPTPPPVSSDAGRLVHYATGAALGLVYGVLAERFKAVTSGFGLSFGTGMAMGIDETLLPALGLAPPVEKATPGQHLYSLASHLVFGASLEGARRLLRGG